MALIISQKHSASVFLLVKWDYFITSLQNWNIQLNFLYHYAKKQEFALGTGIQHPVNFCFHFQKSPTDFECEGEPESLGLITEAGKDGANQNDVAKGGGRLPLSVTSRSKIHPANIGTFSLK